MDHQIALQVRKQEIEKMIKEKNQQMMEASSELSINNIDEDLFDRESSSDIMGLLEIELDKVNEALSRCSSGQYGICESCGAAIEEERLQSMVNATLCSQCARAREKRVH